MVFLVKSSELRRNSTRTTPMASALKGLLCYGSTAGQAAFTQKAQLNSKNNISMGCSVCV